MANIDLILTLAAVVLFTLAGLNVATPTRLEWLAVACLALTLVI